MVFWAVHFDFSFIFVLGVIFSDAPLFHASKSQIIPVLPSGFNPEKAQLKLVHLDHLFGWKRDLEALFLVLSTSLTELVTWQTLPHFIFHEWKYHFLSSLNTQIVSIFQEPADFHFLHKGLNSTPLQPHQLSLLSSPSGTFYFLYQSLFFSYNSYGFMTSGEIFPNCLTQVYVLPP